MACIGQLNKYATEHGYNAVRITQEAVEKNKCCVRSMENFEIFSLFVKPVK